MIKGSVIGTFGAEAQNGTKLLSVAASKTPTWTARALDSNNAVVSGYPNKLGLAIGKWWFKVRSKNILTHSLYSPTMSVDVYKGVTTTTTFSTNEQTNLNGSLKGVKLAWGNIADQSGDGAAGKAITGYIIQISGPDLDALNWREVATAKLGTTTTANSDF